MLATSVDQFEHAPLVRPIGPTRTGPMALQKAPKLNSRGLKILLQLYLHCADTYITVLNCTVDHPLS